jgi:pimeloyl-ACP methyl ester carboxylesterase
MMSVEMVESIRSAVSTADGRSLDVVSSGAAGSKALFVHVGTPSGAIADEHAIRVAAERGLRYVTYARPGYGDSTRRPGRAVADCVEDVRAIARALGLDRLLVVGISGGGPHALACAALAPDLVTACAPIGSVAPFDAEGLDFLAGMGPENVVEFGLAVEGEDALRPYLEREAEVFGAVSGEQVAAALGGLVDEVDRAALSGPYADLIAAQCREALRTGIWGWLDDDLAFARAWGVPLDAVRVPVTIWQGAHDRMVPFEHGRWLADHVAGARAELLPDEGHLSLEVTRLGDIVDRLVAEG